MSVRYRILESLQRQLREFPDLTGEGGIKGIDPRNIVLRHMPLAEDNKSWTTTEETPGILICPGRSMRIDPEAGDNTRDIIPYTFSIQLIDKNEVNRFNADSLRSWCKWEEEIRKYLNQQNLRHELFNDAGFVSLVTVNEQDSMDTQMFAVHSRCVFVTSLTVYSQETRNTQGRK